MIEISIAYDKELNSLSDFAQLLFFKILPHTDDFGRFDGDVEVIKARVDPLGRKKIDKYESAIQEICEAGLMLCYSNGTGKRVIQYKPATFDRINAFLIKQRTDEEYKAYMDSYEIIWGSKDFISYIKYKDKSKKIEKKIKTEYGSYKNVLLTSDEFEKLKKDKGEKLAHEAIDYLSESKEMKGYKYKSDYLAILRWVFDAMKKRQKIEIKDTDELRKDWRKNDPR